MLAEWKSWSSTMLSGLLVGFSMSLSNPTSSALQNDSAIPAAPKVQGNLGIDAPQESPVPEGGEHPKPMSNSHPVLNLDPSHARQHSSKAIPSSRKTGHDRRAIPG